MPTNKLNLLTFPQKWDGKKTLDLRLLVLPKGNPLQPIYTGLPAFAKANLSFDMLIIPSLDRLPDPADVQVRIPVTTTTPPNQITLFNELASRFNINSALPPGNPRKTNIEGSAAVRIKKLLTPSYRNAFAFEQQRTPFAVMDKSYECALTGSDSANRPPKPPLSSEISWGQMLSFVLRQPLLVEQLGLLYQTTVSLPDPTFLQEGGWLYVDFNNASDYAASTITSNLVGRYAARIPPLAKKPRPLFAAVLFPVLSSPAPTGNYDDIFLEAEVYDDGFAKIIHGAQPTRAGIIETDPINLPPIKDVGIRLGWDDEQLVIWMNRQVEPLLNKVDTPMGVFAYRVDVRKAGTTKWNSLVRVQGNLQLGNIGLGTFDGELGVEALPTQLQGKKIGDFWLPSYLTTWSGSSLVVSDATAFEVSGQDDVVAKRMYQPVNADAVPLRYGNDYEFRVRLMDISGGGPEVKDQPINPAPAPIATVPFRRFVPPKPVKIESESVSVDPMQPETSYRVQRPRLGYPDLLFTGFPRVREALIADLDIARSQEREVGLPDPDVTTLQISVAVRSLAMDRTSEGVDGDNYVLLFTTTRQFPDDLDQPLELQIEFQDVKDIAFLKSTDPLTPQPGEGSLVLPSARDIRLTLTPICRPDPDLTYFGNEAARIGIMPVQLSTRAPSQDESSLLVPDVPGNRFRAIMLQPDEFPTENQAAQQSISGNSGQAPLDLAQRLAQELDLKNSVLTLFGKLGRRAIFGCSNAIRHVLAPDNSGITFASKSDLIKHWLMVISVQVDRDWTWDALNYMSFEVKRGEKIIGSINMPRIINAGALDGSDRSKTHLYFFDAIDPKPEDGAFPGELNIEYTVTPSFKVEPTNLDSPLTLGIELPIAVPPTQVPKLVSAGIALSPYVRTEDYSLTQPRQRILWFEFEDPVANPKDAYFARVVSYAPDPMLTRLEPIPPEVEPVKPSPESPLPIDPELIRVIRPNQSDDRAGLNAMQRLVPSEPITPSATTRHFMIPLPDGIFPDSRELFGFFTYELRVGHSEGWSTAQGRYGTPLKVTGVQHPAPLLTCKVGRRPAGITVSAPHATPIFEGRNLLPLFPATRIWVLLYAQVTQVDGSDRRNILLGQKPTRIFRQSDFQEEIDLFGVANWDQREVEQSLNTFALKKDSSLSVLAVELLPENKEFKDPLGENLGQVRIIRTSPLTPVPSICV
jgi:hypothetical protein